jgi:hypothetical protein
MFDVIPKFWIRCGYLHGGFSKLTGSTTSFNTMLAGLAFELRHAHSFPRSKVGVMVSIVYQASISSRACRGLRRPRITGGGAPPHAAAIGTAPVRNFKSWHNFLPLRLKRTTHGSHVLSTQCASSPKIIAFHYNYGEAALTARNSDGSQA